MVEQLISMTSIPPALMVIAFLVTVGSVCAAIFFVTGSMLASSLVGFFAVGMGVVIGWLPGWILVVCLLLSVASMMGRIMISSFEEGGSNEEKIVKFSLFGIPLIKK